MKDMDDLDHADGEVVFENDQFYHKKPADQHIQELLQFVQSHESTLAAIHTSTREALADAPETHYRPIKVALEPKERVLPSDLIMTENNELRKILTVLLFNCDEIHELQLMAESKFYSPLLMFGQQPMELENDPDYIVEPSSTGYAERQIGKLLPTLQELSNFIERCYAVAVNMVQQLSAIHDNRQSHYEKVFSLTHLRISFVALGDLLRMLITIDTIIRGNEQLAEAWAQYKLMISFVRADPASFGTDEFGVTKFERLLVSIDAPLMTGQIFEGCLEQNFESIDDGGEEDEMISIRGNKTFLDELLFFVKTRLDETLSPIGSNAEMHEREQIMSSFALYALYRRLLPKNIPPDGKLFRAFWLVQKTVPFVVIVDKFLWFPGEFLQESAAAPGAMGALDPPSAPAFRKLYMEKYVSHFPNKANLVVAQCTAWFILLESKFQASVRYEANTVQALETRSSILFKGACLATRVSHLIKTCLVAHVAMEMALSRTLLNCITQLMEILKGIEYSFIRKDSIIAEAQVHILRVFSVSLVDLIRPVRTKLHSVRKLDDARGDLMACLQILEQTICGTESYTPLRQHLVSILVEIMTGSNFIEEKDAVKINSMLKRILMLANISTLIKKACNTSFLSFHSQLLPVLVAGIYETPTCANRIFYIVGAFSDSVKLCESVKHRDVKPYIINLRKSIHEVIKAEIIEPLSRDIETDLRLHIHTKHLDHLESVNPKSENLKPLRPFLDLPVIRVLGLQVNIKKEVTHYLDRNFYNLTTVALHDWHTYHAMRNLASEKLGLTLLDNFLPMGSLEQGLDVLQIMRNIHVFVGRYTYNMNMQEFVEYKPDKGSKHLNTIKIQSIAASIRQHGLGMLNTTVNFTYQFLIQQFHIFTEFLYDENIRSPLSKDCRWYKKHKADPEVNYMFPYERAAKFVKDIRRLGVNDGMSFLDQFRILITRIGNALGYVRMVRSAAMHYCSQAVKYLPELEDTISFEHYSKSSLAMIIEGVEVENSEGDTSFSPETVRAGKNLDQVICTLIKNFGEGSDFFKILVQVFQETLGDESHDHLKYFYAIVPPLCISWVEASLHAKDAMYKITRGASVREMYYADDGFAMGIAYCLAVLKQTNKYESFNWQESVKAYQKEEMKKVKALQNARTQKEQAIIKKKKRQSSIIGSLMSLGKSKKDEDEEDDEDLAEADLEEFNTLQVSAKRLEAQRRESEQLAFSINGAEIFFRRSDLK